MKQIVQPENVGSLALERGRIERPLKKSLDCWLRYGQDELLNKGQAK